MGKYIVLDVVFYGSSLNYDQGTGNYQELKKITKWDGKQYALVSRYALRYSMLHTGEKLGYWKLAKKEDFSNDKVPQPKKELVDNGKIIVDYPEWDLFGFMIASGNTSFTRTSPVKISHAISMTPYNFDSHFCANLDIMKRARGTGEGSNPVNMEEKKDFYIYNVTIDVDRVGVYTKEESAIENEINIDDGNDNKEKVKRIENLIKVIFNLKREIKGRMEDLSPWLVICGLYDDMNYNTYLDKIELAKSHKYSVITKEKDSRDNDGKTVREIEHQIIEKDAPKFIIDINVKNSNGDGKVNTIENINDFATSNGKKKSTIWNFIDSKGTGSGIYIYKRKFVETEPEI